MRTLLTAPPGAWRLDVWLANSGRLAGAGVILSFPMVTLAELHERVVAAYGQLGLPSWPDPHPGIRSPRGEEYSRFTQPDRYRIVQARAHV